MENRKNFVYTHKSANYIVRRIPLDDKSGTLTDFYEVFKIIPGEVETFVSINGNLEKEILEACNLE